MSTYTLSRVHLCAWLQCCRPSSFPSLGKVELGSLKYPSPLQLSLHDLVEMRGAGSWPKQTALFSGCNEKEQKESTDSLCVRLFVCTLWVFWLMCVLLGIHKRIQDLCNIGRECSCCFWVVVNQPQGWGFVGSADAPKIAVNGSEPSH